MNNDSISKILLLPVVMLPLIWVMPFLLGLSAEGYDSLAQHISELGQNHLSTAKRVFLNTSAFIVGLASLLFPLGLLVSDRKVSCTVVFGALYSFGMISNSIFPMGTPLHGMYGLPIFSIMMPLFYLLEHETNESQKWFHQYSLFAAAISLFYLWLMISGLDPNRYQGLTQRIAILVLNFWFAFAAYRLIRRH